jgi:hypothetical protein
MLMHAAWVHAISPVSHHITPGVKAVRLETWQTYAVKASGKKAEANFYQ